jgi:hypothetical protein
MKDPRDAVREEMDRFIAALPKLLREIPGKWVVFREGKVQSIHEDQDSAYVAGRRMFGSHGGQVIAQVAEIRPIRVFHPIVSAT